MEFDQYAEQYDAGFMGKGSTRFYRDLIRELEIRDGNAVLDVGCGTGTILEWIGKGLFFCYRRFSPAALRGRIHGCNHGLHGVSSLS